MTIAASPTPPIPPAAPGPVGPFDQTSSTRGDHALTMDLASAPSIAIADAAPRSEHQTDVVSREVVAGLLDAVPDAVIVVDDTGAIIGANAQTTAVFGYEPGELTGQKIEILVPPRIRPDHPARRQSYTRRPMGLLQLAAVRKNGQEFPAEISLAPVDTDTGRTLTVATVRDITERLQQQKQAAEEAERMRDELLATITHELRTPLTSILGYVEVMEDLPDHDLSASARHMLGIISRNGHRELRLINDLLTVATGALGHIRLARQHVDINALVAQVIADHQERATEAAVHLAAHPRANSDHAAGPGDPHTEPAIVQVDPERISELVGNLLDNAIKFSTPGTLITLTTQVLLDNVVITVHDNGPGVDPDDQPRVFERLYRGRNAQHAETPGAGLGLAIAHAITTAHHGTITLTSNPHHGTTVTLQLPTRPQQS